LYEGADCGISRIRRIATLGGMCLSGLYNGRSLRHMLARETKFLKGGKKTGNSCGKDGFGKERVERLLRGYGSARRGCKRWCAQGKRFLGVELHLMGIPRYYWIGWGRPDRGGLQGPTWCNMFSLPGRRIMAIERGDCARSPQCRIQVDSRGDTGGGNLSLWCPDKRRMRRGHH